MIERTVPRHARRTEGEHPELRKVRVLHYNAFTTEPEKGNPAGVVFDADTLSDTQMQEVAPKVGFNETVFVLRSHLRVDIAGTAVYVNAFDVEIDCNSGYK